MVHRGHDHRDHFALEPRQAGIAHHQLVVILPEMFEPAGPQGVGAEHVGHEADLFLKLCEQRLDRRIEAALVGQL